MQVNEKTALDSGLKLDNTKFSKKQVNNTLILCELFTVLAIRQMLF
jgi:hypothetical protein